MVWIQKDPTCNFEAAGSRGPQNPRASRACRRSMRRWVRWSRESNFFSIETQETKEFNGACSRCILTRLRRDCVRLGLRVTGYWACKTHPGQQTTLASLATRKLYVYRLSHPPSPTRNSVGTLATFSLLDVQSESYELLPYDRKCK